MCFYVLIAIAHIPHESSSDGLQMKLWHGKRVILRQLQRSHLLKVPSAMKIEAAGEGVDIAPAGQ